MDDFTGFHPVLFYCNDRTEQKGNKASTQLYHDAGLSVNQTANVVVCTKIRKRVAQ